MHETGVVRRFNANGSLDRKIILKESQTVRFNDCTCGCSPADLRTPGIAGQLTVQHGTCRIVAASPGLRIANHDDPTEQLRPAPLKITPVPYELAVIELADGSALTIHTPLEVHADLARCATSEPTAVPDINDIDYKLIWELSEPHRDGETMRTLPIPELARRLNTSTHAIDRRLSSLIASHRIGAPDQGAQGLRTRAILTWAIDSGILSASSRP